MRPHLLAWAALVASPWLLAEGPPACPQWRDDPALLERLERLLAGQGLANGLRVSIGTEEETRGFAAALRDIVGEGA